ncbi:secreted immunoglobulin domain 1 isoform X4 [Antennarius striatus]|uniref:secreted immunoglobulin domain 1 isoform X4 n=1 Tax=Antennarius striatus TaxID=241820 RepID=UPI0035B4F557
MASALVCLMLLSVSGATVPPASTVKVRVGEDATLQCPLLDANSPSSRADPPTISWYRVAPGQSPQLLLSIRSTDVRPGPGGEAGRFTGGPDGSMRLSASRRSDSAVYYCSITEGRQQEEMGDDGT